MKRLVNGVEVELPDHVGTPPRRLGDRWIVPTSEGTFTAASVRVGDSVHVSFRGRQFLVEKPSRARQALQHASGEMHAPMPGQVVEVFVRQGEQVAKGQRLLVLEAMKTQQTYAAPFDGVVAKLAVAAGEQVAEGALLVLVEEAPTA